MNQAKSMNDDIAARLKEIVGARGFVEDPREVALRATDWRGKYRGRSPLLLLPSSTEQVSRVLEICHETATPVVPQGGNTGLVGAQIPFHGEVILGLARLSRIRSVDRVGACLVGEAGVLLQAAQEAARDSDLLLPIRMASEGSCTLGGIAATNAGGINVLRYGMTRENVLGLEVVLANGRTLDLLRTLRKDNTGYDLKQLFIGAEGTLGVITAVALRLSPRQRRQATALIAVPHLDAALALLTQTKGACELDAFELFSRGGLELVLRHIPGTTDPLGGPSPWYVLLEASGAEDVEGHVEGALEAALTEGRATDAVIAASEAQRSSLWKLRECLSEAEKLEGASLKHDISVPVAAVPEFVGQATAAVAAAFGHLKPVPFGHLGDGSLHFNFVVAEGKVSASQAKEIADIVYDTVRRFGGSFSAEHGIGVMKCGELGRYRSAAEIEAMILLKRTYDPKNILNPGKLLPITPPA